MTTFKYLIPARGGSKEIRRKNLRSIAGKSLIQRAINCALEVANENDVIVSSDDPDILSVAKEMGVIGHQRSAHAASDSAPMIDVINEVIQEFPCDFIVLLQPTSPFRRSETIKKAREKIIKCPSANSLVSVQKLPHNCHPTKIMEMDGEGYLQGGQSLQNRQKIENKFIRDGNIYITRTKNLKNGILAKPTTYVVSSLIESIDINSEFDLKLAEIVGLHEDSFHHKS